ncbi:MAG: dihydrodipicolinate synthase family protein [Armatimonadetes bacterium]|nr:dihydrodipicolinate synthase family protein [Armatimonadota bacterium]
MPQELRGVLPVLHTPYHDDYSIDYDTLGEEADFAYEMGADGIVFALASETLRLTQNERFAVAEYLGKRNADRGSFTMSVGAESNVSAAQFARQAESSGASALMAIPPLSVSLGEEALRGYYAAILGATTIPLVVQDASSYVGKPMSAEFQTRLRLEFGARVYFKPEAPPVGPVISALNAATNGEAKIFEGSGGTMLAENYRRGITGTMPGTDLIDAIVALWRALERGDDDKIYAISPLIGAILAMVHSLDGYLAIEKYLLYKRGVFKNRLVREPVGFTLDPPALAEIDRLYERLQAQL